MRDLEEPQYWLETDEVLADSLVTGAPAQIVHINSSYHEDAPQLLVMVSAARARGIDISVEAYPYNSSATSIESLPDTWKNWPDSKFRNYEWVPPANG